MENDARVLRQLIHDGMYVIDPYAVADSLLIRSRLRYTVARPVLMNERREVEVRSFRRDPRARSFRLARPHTSPVSRR